MKYTNFNSCWERRAQRQPLGLGAREGRRFGFRPAPAAECEVDKVVNALLKESEEPVQVKEAA